MTTVGEVMTSNPIVAQVPGSRNEVLKVMVKHNLTGLPVVRRSDGSLAGIITRQDIFDKPDEDQAGGVDHETASRSPSALGRKWKRRRKYFASSEPQASGRHRRGQAGRHSDADGSAVSGREEEHLNPGRESDTLTLYPDLPRRTAGCSLSNAHGKQGLGLGRPGRTTAA